MIQNYLKIALRNLLRNKVYSFINIAGLALGLTVSMLILLFVMHEISFDKFHANGDRIFQVIQEVKIDGNNGISTGMSSKLAPSMKADNPEIIDYTRILQYSRKKKIIKNPENPYLRFNEKDLIFAEPSFLQLFDFQLLEGDKISALANPFSMIITETIAKKYFGNQNPIGKTLLYDNKYLFTITALAKNLPSNSTFQFNILMSLNTIPKLDSEGKYLWENVGTFDTYFLLDSPKSATKIASNISKYEKLTGNFDPQVTNILAPFAQEHLHGFEAKFTNVRYINLFLLIALVILLLAFFNYMSLTTSQATKRAKEVGIRKVTGANRISLIKQFYLESLLMCLFAFSFSFLLIELLRQPFYDILGLKIDASFLHNPLYIITLISIFILSVLITGSYPAMILSGFSPMEIIKGNVSKQLRGHSFRKGIIVFQFAVSITLIIVAFIIHRQLSYLQNKDLGMNINKVFCFEIKNINKNFEGFRNDIARLEGVEKVSFSVNRIFDGYGTMTAQHTTTKKDVYIISANSDVEMIDVLGLKWKFPPTQKNKTDWYEKHFLNETAVRELGIRGNPIGQYFTVLGSNSKQIIAGVFKDFHYTGTLSKITPWSVFPMKADSNSYNAGTFYIKLNQQANIQAKLAIIKHLFEQYDNANPFEYYFLDEAFHSLFTSIERMANMFIIFMVVAIFIACMGLFGLIAFAAETRTKEIGIRKVLGASVSQIVGLLSKDFLVLVFVSILIASPIAYYFMQKWLQDFAFRIEISWWIFALAGFVALLIALLTVSYQAIKAALANPVKSLRTE